MKFYLEQVDSVLAHVKSSEKGLTSAEAEKEDNVPENYGTAVRPHDYHSYHCRNYFGSYGMV